MTPRTMPGARHRRPSGRRGCRRVAGAVVAAAAVWSATAVGATTQDAVAAGLAATCSACHVPDAAAAAAAMARATPPGQPAPAPLPVLAGMPAARLAEQMRAFKRGARPSTVMQQLAKGYSDAQIDQLAAYFAALPKADR